MIQEAIVEAGNLDARTLMISSPVGLKTIERAWLWGAFLLSLRNQEIGQIDDLDRHIADAEQRVAVQSRARECLVRERVLTFLNLIAKDMRHGMPKILLELPNKAIRIDHETLCRR